MRRRRWGAERVEASTGGGMVKAIASGNGDLVGIEIDPQAVDPDEVELLQDMAAVLAAVTEAFRQAAALQQQERMGAITGGLGGLGIRRASRKK